MRLLSRVLIAFVLVFVAANSGWAGIYNNTSSPDSREDSLCITFQLLDTLGVPSARATGDSLYFYLYAPSGFLCYKDSARILTDTKIQHDQRVFKWGSSDLTISQMAYKRKISDIDTMTANGTFKWTLIAWDSSMRLITPYYGEFQIVTQGNLSNILDSAAVQAQEIWTATGGDSVLQALDYTNNTHEVVRQVVSTVATVTDVTNSLGTELTASEVNADVSNEIWASTGGDSVLNALDYTNNTHEVVRQVASQVNSVVSVLTVTNTVTADVESFAGNSVSIVSGLPSVHTTTISTGAIDSLDIDANVYTYLAGLAADSTWRKGWAFATGTAATTGQGLDAIRDSTDEMAATGTLSAANMGSIADSVWKKGVVQVSFGDADSTFADAFVNTGGQINVWANLDTATGTLDAAQIGTDAIGEAEIAAGAITTSEIATGAIDDDAVADGAIDWGGELDTTGFGANAQEAAADAIVAQDVMLASDTTTIPDNVWSHGTRTLTAGSGFSLSASAMRSISDSVWKAGVKGMQTGDADSTFADAFVNTSGQAYAIIEIDTSGGTIANSQVDADVDVNVLTASTGSIEDQDVATLTVDTTGQGTQIWSHGTKRLTELDEDNTTIDLNATTIGTVTTVTNSPFSAANAGSVADSVWRKGGAKVRLSDGDTTAIAMLYHIRDSMDEASQAASLTAGNMGSIADSVWRKASTGGPVYADGTFGDVIKNDSIAIDAIRDSMDEASQTGVGGGSCDCGNGAQTVTIKVADTSGTYTVVPNAKVSVIVGSTSVWGTTNGSGIATLYLDDGTYTAYAYSSGYNFTAKSVTVAGAAKADSILGYDVATSAGGSVPSGEQATLYDWVVTAANDTLYNAQVEITLTGPGDCYTSSVLVPPTTVRVRTGINDATVNGGKWQETVFVSDSILCPGGDETTYTIRITSNDIDKSGLIVEYRNVRIPAAYAGSSVRLRTLIEAQGQ